MSGGRVELGLGTGWYEGEHTAYGIPFPPLGERFERLEEQLAIITGCGTPRRARRSPSPAKHYQLVDSPALPKPVQQPHPPIIVGGGGPTPHPAPGRHLRRRVQPGLPRGGRDRGAVRPGARRLRGRSGATRRPSVCRRPRWSAAAPTKPRSPAGPRPSGARWPSCAPTALAGTPDEVVARCRALGAAGADTVYLQVLDLEDLDHIRLLGEACYRISPEDRVPPGRGSRAGWSTGRSAPSAECGPVRAGHCRARGGGSGRLGLGEDNPCAACFRRRRCSPVAVGQSSAVRGRGVYSVVDAMKDPPPLRLCATPPIPMAGLPTHLVPTMAHTVGEGHATP